MSCDCQNLIRNRLRLNPTSLLHKMLSGKFKQILSVDTALTNNKQYRRFVTSRFLTKRCVWINRWLANRSSIEVSGSMSPTLRFKFLLRGLGVSRLWSVWTRSLLVSSVVRRCRRERGVRDVLQCFRQTLLRPRHTLLLSATAAYKSAGGEDDGPPPCYNNITDEDMQALINDLVELEELARLTLYCEGCDKRVVIDKKVPGVVYCPCKESQQKMESPDGWVPYMEAEDVIIWRKEYKPGQGLYAYKVYGRYADVEARDFAAVQVDGAYRRAWDAAVAALAVVERDANGLRDQAVLHWEVLWPRLFANRDYVYIRRHKEFDVRAACLAHKDGIFAGERRACGAARGDGAADGGRGDAGGGSRGGAGAGERPSVHSRAKRKAIEEEQRQRGAEREGQGEGSAPADNKVYVIVSRSCVHPGVPETRRAIRVAEYWSHMVVQTLRGDGAPGMEFVLTYYDEPGVGGMPVGVAAWAAGRAAPAYLQRMRRAASDYRAWRSQHPQDTPDFTPFSPENVSQRGGAPGPRLREEDMESSRQGPEMDEEVSAPPEAPDDAVAPEEPATPDAPETPLAADAPVTPGAPEAEVTTSDKSTQTVGEPPLLLPPPVPVEHPESPREARAPTCDVNVQVNMDPPPQSEGDGDKPQEGESNGRWWRYLYPFYYFV